jgi:hypothetical protein
MRDVALELRRQKHQGTGRQQQQQLSVNQAADGGMDMAALLMEALKVGEHGVSAGRKGKHGHVGQESCCLWLIMVQW